MVSHQGTLTPVGVATREERVLVVNLGSVIDTSRLFHASRIPPQVSLAGR